MEETGILGKRVTIGRPGFIYGKEGIIAEIYSTRKGPSFRIRILWDGVPRGSGVALKRHEFVINDKETN